MATIFGRGGGGGGGLLLMGDYPVHGMLAILKRIRLC